MNKVLGFSVMPHHQRRHILEELMATDTRLQEAAAPAGILRRVVLWALQVGALFQVLKGAPMANAVKYFSKKRGCRGGEGRFLPV